MRNRGKVGPGRYADRRRSLLSSRRGKRTRGQSLVEFALISPLFLALIFGIVEYALINASIGAFDFAAFEGARVGAIDGKTPLIDPTQATVDADILASGIIPHVQGVVFAKIARVDVFRANVSGGCYNGGTFPCQYYDDYYTPTGGWTTVAGGGWPEACRDDQLIGADYLGVRIVYNYTYITALLAEFSPTLTLTAVSVQRIEPQEYNGQNPPSSCNLPLASRLAPANQIASAPANNPPGQWVWLPTKRPTIATITDRKATVYAA